MSDTPAYMRVDRKHVRTGVCVGGPLDGQVKNILHGNSFEVPTQRPVIAQPSGELIGWTGDVYVGETLHISHTVYIYWRWQHMTVEDSIRKLLFGYAGLDIEGKPKYTEAQVAEARRLNKLAED